MKLELLLVICIFLISEAISIPKDIKVSDIATFEDIKNAENSLLLPEYHPLNKYPNLKRSKRDRLIIINRHNKPQNGEVYYYSPQVPGGYNYKVGRDPNKNQFSSEGGFNDYSDGHRHQNLETDETLQRPQLLPRPLSPIRTSLQKTEESTDL